MSKSVLGIILGLIAVVVIGGVIIAGNKDDDEPATTSQTQTQNDTESTTEKVGQNGTANEASMSASVEIRDSAYSPSTIKVKKGGTVTWTNRDNIEHDVVPDEEGNNFEKSELLSQGENYSFTFNTVGTYTYHCTPHPFMHGTVEVIE